MLSVKKMLTKLLANTIKQGRWNAQIYDFNTFRTTLNNQIYWKIGPSYFCRIYVSSFPNTTFSTMIQIRNLPCVRGMSGTIYFATVNGYGGTWTFQEAGNHTVYLRPNFTGTINGGVMSALIIGSDE